MCKVIVIMSTYNGEKYVKQQLDSLLEQTYQNIEIYVRDDGSSDDTIEILKEYEKNNKIHLELGENCGFIKSFFMLIKNAPESDYYAFCDQDDIWKKDKIELAVAKLKKTDQAKPALYFSDYDYYDQEMNYVGRCKSHKKGPSFRNALVDCISLGISSVINKTACDIMKQHVPLHCCGHDWWAYMLCAGMGTVIYDKTCTVNYRRHAKNVSPGGMGFIQFQIWRIKKFIVNDYFSNVREQLGEYQRLYGEYLSQEDQKVLSLFTDGCNSSKVIIKKLFFPHFFRQKLSDEIMLRVIFLLRKL